LIIGRGGEQLHKIVNETQCKLQIAPDRGGLPERIVTLAGTKGAIERDKRAIDEVLRRTPGYGGGGGGGDFQSGQQVFEMRLPGNKCGLVIGKGGETIKRLSEQYGVKLVVVQETNAVQGSDKPLRITGDPDKVAQAREAVNGLIGLKDDGRGGGSTNEYGSNRSYSGSRSGQSEVLIKVPGDKAGIVIGKGGESIKEINRRSGAHVEIDKTQRNGEGAGSGDKMFVIRGTSDQIESAQKLIYEKITGNQGSQPPNGYFNDQMGGGNMGGYDNGRNSDNSQYQNQQQQQQWNYQQPGADPNNMQAWQAYYQYYQGGGAAAPGVPGAVAGGNAVAGTAASGTTVQPSVNPSTGQPDYSSAWVEYYRSLGMFEQADAILRQTQTAGNGTVTGQTATNGSSTNGSSGSVPQPAGGGSNGQNGMFYGGKY